MTEQELKARIEPLGKRTRYELIRALYIWVSYGVKVQFSHLFSKKGMCVFNRLCEEFPPQFTEEDEKKKEKLMKNANIAVTIGTLCRKLQNFVENYNTLEKTTKLCRKLQSQPSSPDKESREKKASLPPVPSIIEKEKRQEKENKRFADAITYTRARETDGDGGIVSFSSDLDNKTQSSGETAQREDYGEFDSAEYSSVPDNDTQSSGEESPREDDGEVGRNPSATVLDVNVQAFMNYWNAQDQRIFVPCQYLNGVQTVFLKRLLDTKGLQFVKMAIDICTKAVFFHDWAQRGYRLDTGFFLDDEHFTKIINHRYDKRHKRLDKHQQAIEYARREAYEDLQRSTRKALESHEGLLEELSRDLPDA